jgi:hypothetical protein
MRDCTSEASRDGTGTEREGAFLDASVFDRSKPTTHTVGTTDDIGVAKDRPKFDTQQAPDILLHHVTPSFSRKKARKEKKANKKANKKGDTYAHSSPTQSCPQAVPSHLYLECARVCVVT